MSAEEWREIPGFEGRYAVSDQGRVKSLARVVVERGPRGAVRQRPARVLAPALNSSGYPQVVLYDADRKPRSKRVHCLVLEPFVGPRVGDMEGCHNDGVKTNNTLPNLRWDTKSANTVDRYRHDPPTLASHCRRGHPFTAANTYVARSGKRRCRTCIRVTDRRRREKAA